MADPLLLPLIKLSLHLQLFMVTVQWHGKVAQ
jgi:hypothetical protein